jgi:hypothetical protein
MIAPRQPRAIHRTVAPGIGWDGLRREASINDIDEEGTNA